MTNLTVSLQGVSCYPLNLTGDEPLLVKRLRAEGWSVEESGPLEIRIAPPGETSHSVFNLSNLYRQYNEGALIGDIVNALLRTLRETGGSVSDVERLDQQQLMPLLKHRGLLDEVASSRVDAIAWQPFITDELIVTLVLDFSQSVRFVKAAEVEASGQPFDDLLEVALANLYARTEGALYEMGDKETGKLFILATQDGYDATRILLSLLLERLAQLVNGELVIGIPNRDFLIAFGNANPMLVGQIGQQVKQDAQSRTYPLTSTLFTFRDGQLKVYAK